MNKLFFGLVGLVALGWTTAATAQGCAYGQDFDSCMAQQLSGMQQQNNAAIQQNYYAYMQQYGPMLQQAYQEWGYQSGVSFDEFAYYMLMTANGTNVQAALDLQRQTFEGLQSAHDTRRQAGEVMIDSMQRNSDAALNAVEGYDMGAVRGSVMVDGPNGPVELPYADVPVGQSFNASDGYTYMMTAQGYAVWTGFGWTLLQ